jgi:polysaccharide biosynthesis/export protein
VRVCALGFAALLVVSTHTLFAQQSDYVIGPQDVLTITVWDQEDLAGKFSVETDGTFTFPLIGRVKAGGLTLRDLEAELKRRLADGFFVNPQVTVSIEQYRSQRVFVVGEVRTPGTYVLTGDMSLIEILARAGSTLPSAGDQAVIVHPAVGTDVSGPLLPDAGTTVSQSPEAQAEVTRVDIRDLQKGVLGQNVRLRDGDTVFVPRADTAFVFGQVKNPGEYAVKNETTVLQALSLAGGVTDRGSTGRIKIVRLVDGKKKEIGAKLNDVVLPGDTIIVQERFF